MLTIFPLTGRTGCVPGTGAGQSTDQVVRTDPEDLQRMVLPEKILANEIRRHRHPNDLEEMRPESPFRQGESAPSPHDIGISTTKKTTPI